MAKKYKRIFTIVVDSLGIGPLPDSPEFGDVDVDTLGHIASAMGGIKMPNLQKLLKQPMPEKQRLQLRSVMT